VACVWTSHAEGSVGLEDLPPEEVIFGSTRAMLDIRRKVERAASADIPVLLQGETGTGKEVLARFLHRASPRAGGPFVKVNCPAVPGPLFESELFGYEKGAFTGASETKLGRVELCQGGTLFLDEIVDLDLSLQAKLLQLLQDGQFCRIGGHRERHIEARIVCATNRPLQQAAQCGAFRLDLFYRISALSVELPNLQQRSGDIPMLVAYFLEKYSRKYCRAVPPFSNSLLGRLQASRWAGNIRQLENLIHRYVVFESEQALRASLEERSTDYAPVEIPSDGTLGLKKTIQQAVKPLERRIILQALEANGWNRGLAARQLRMSYGALLYKMKEMGLPVRKQAKLFPAEAAELPDSAEAGTKKASRPYSSNPEVPFE
jgi:two-component system, NtrC family, response regulator AtoC